MKFKTYKAYAIRFLPDGSLSPEIPISTTELRDCDDARTAVKKLAENIRNSPYSYPYDVIEWDRLTVRIEDPNSPTEDSFTLQKNKGRDRYDDPFDK